MNIPEPIIPPATIIVASKAPSLGLNSVVSAVLVVDMVISYIVIRVIKKSFPSFWGRI
jgi:hypothetical protein